jgi:hypothetical protein
MRVSDMDGNRRRSGRLCGLSVAAAGVMALATASSAGAAVTIGQLAPGSPADDTCNALQFDLLQPTVTSGNTYVVPATVATGTVNSWSTNAAAVAGQRYTMKVFRQVTGLTYTVVGHDGPRSLTPGVVNTFPANIPVRQGDVLGFNDNDGSAVTNACLFPIAGESHLERMGSLADGASGTFFANPNFRINVTAVVEPTNTFTLGGITRNKKKGTATITTTVPNPGDLSGSGKGAKVTSAGATISKAVTPGTAKLVIRAKGKKKRKLNDTGKVKLNTTITYTPTGGAPLTQTRKVKLKKNV